MVLEPEMAAAFAAHTTGQTHFTRRMAIAIADQFGLRPMEVVRQLERAGALKPHSVDWFRDNGGITADHITEARGDRPAPTTDRQEG